MFINLQNMKILAILLAAVLAGPLEYDKTVHDFGEISIKDGPVSCTFTVTNVSDEPVTIFAVVTSCGCTSAEWTRTAIEPGGKGEIKATFSNEDGPYPFDKTLTVYTEAKKPAILHIKGVVKNKKAK